MKELMKKTKLKDIYIQNVWSNVMQIEVWPVFTKDINPRIIDEISTEDNNADIVRAMRKQMEEMSQNMQKPMMEMQAMLKVSRGVMGGGFELFGITHCAHAGPVHFPWLPSHLWCHPVMGCTPQIPRRR